MGPQGAWPGTSSGRTLPSSAGGPQLTSVLGCDPASSQVHWKEPEASHRLHACRGGVQAPPLATAGRWASVLGLGLWAGPPPPSPHHSAGRLPECWPAPPGSCLQSSVPRPGDWRTLTPIAASYGQVSPWFLPLLCPQALGWGPMGASVCPRPLTPLLAQGPGQGLSVGFSLKYRGYCLSSVSDVFHSHPPLLLFTVAGWVTLSPGSQALAGDTEVPLPLGPYLVLCLLSSAVCTSLWGLGLYLLGSPTVCSGLSGVAELDG